MKKCALLVLFPLLALAGCTDPIAANKDQFVEYPQVHLTSYWLKTWTRVQPPIVNRVGSGMLDVTIPIRNLTENDLSVDFQYSFKVRGARVEGPSSWQNLVIPRKGTNDIHFTSMKAIPGSPEGDFEVEVRYRK